MAAMSVGEKSGWVTAGRRIPIDVSDVERLLEPWRGTRRVAIATLLDGGLMNRNYRVRVGEDDVVLRFYDRDPRACAKEVALLNAVQGRLPAPRVLYAAPHAAPAPFVVLEFVDGISLRDLKRTGDRSATVDAAHSAGLVLAALASVSPTAFVHLATDVAPSEVFDGPNFNARLIDHFLASPHLQERIGASTVMRVRDFAWRHDEGLAAAHFPSAIAHGDFNSANILVRPHAGRWTVAAVLDWEFAFAGSMAYDIGNFLRYERSSSPWFEPGFSRGLVDGDVELPSDWRTTARVADLSALCELLTRPEMPTHVADEVRGLVLATLDGADLPATPSKTQ